MIQFFSAFCHRCNVVTTQAVERVNARNRQVAGLECQECGRFREPLMQEEVRIIRLDIESR